MSTIKSLIAICELAIRAKDAEIDCIERNITERDRHWEELDADLTWHKDELKSAEARLATFEAEVSELAKNNKWLEEQRDNLLKQHAMVCGQRDDEISKTQKLLGMLRDIIGKRMAKDNAQWGKVSDSPTLDDYRELYHGHDAALNELANLINANINEE